MPRENPESADEKIIATENLRTVKIVSLNHAICLESSFSEDNLEKLTERALQLLKEVKEEDEKIIY